MNLLRIAKTFWRGEQTIQDWLGDGCEVVHRDHAAVRARTCVHCPLHRYPPKPLPEKLARLAMIAPMVLKRADLKLDERLGTCDVCDCYMPLKVWIKRKVIVENMSPGDIDDYPYNCWLVKEYGLDEAAGPCDKEPSADGKVPPDGENRTP